MSRIHFLAEKGIPYLKDYFKDWGEWTEFSDIKDLLGNHDQKHSLLKKFEDVDHLILFIKTSTQFNSNWDHISWVKKIRIVGTAAVGSDHIDLTYLNQKKIVFYHSPGCNRSAVTDYVFFLIFKYCVLRNRPLSTLTVGILGLGHIGSRLATQLLALNIPVVAYDPLYPLKNKPSWLPRKNPLLTLCSNSEEVLSHPDLDVITLHVPLTINSPHPTYHIINKNNLPMIVAGRRKKVLLINSSRGGVVCEKSLLSFTDRVDYAVDVWENEPSIEKTIAERSLFITPHIAGYTYRAKREAAKMLFLRVASHLIKNRWSDHKRVVLPRLREGYAERDDMIFDFEQFIELGTKLRKIGLEKMLYSIYRRMTGLSAIEKETRKIIPFPKKARAIRFTALRKNYLRHELADYGLPVKFKNNSKKVTEVFKVLKR